jgi:selenocysteine lyase/cysteine desulfurase
MPFESPVALHLGLGTAIDHALDLGIDAIATQVGRIAEHLRTTLSSVDGVAVHDGGTRRSGIVTFTVAGVPPTEVKAAAAGAGVNVSVTEAAAARLDMGGARPEAVVRASPHYTATEEECARLVEVVAGLGPA